MERASRKKYHYIYKTTCIVTNRFYIGMHSTDNLEDGYQGSGKRLWYSVNKHGRDNHVTEILEFLPDRNSLKAREEEIVNEELIGEELCMNLALGGGGGSGTMTNEQLSKGGTNANKVKWTNPEFRDKMSRLQSIRNKGLHAAGKFKYDNFTNKSHSEESKRKIGEANSTKQKGTNNSQYGKCWITNGIENQKIYKSDLIPEGWKLGRKM